MAYGQLEPWGPERADLRAALIASTVANGSRDSEAHPDPYLIEDFLLDFSLPETDEERVERLKLAMRGITQQFGGAPS